ncbi:MAG: P-loop NTPase fold protein [Candidatus Omnitrophota bacterium]|nr:P-loop NTPase fold protein [Candidatus Omnitrophota bacterium]
MSNNDNYRIGEHIREDGKKYAEFDTLGFDSTREIFIKVIKPAGPPLTIGLYGSWGSGKTEMIKALEEDLKTSDCLTLIFDAWKYRYECNLILPLICALQREHLSKIEDAKDSAKKIVTSAALVMANQFLKNKIGVNIGEVKMALQTYEEEYKHYKKYDDNVALIEKEYKDFIGVLLNKTEKKKLTVFIDNLDRCLPDITVNLLEDISSFLSIQGVPCIYVLAMDKENVIKAINHRYPDFDGMHYLEKIVHIGLKMPLPRKRENHNSSYGTYHFLKRYEWGKKYEAVSKSGDSRDKLFERLVAIDNVFGGDLLGNPRRAERIVNKLMMLEIMGLFQAERSHDDVSMLIFLLLLCEYFPKIYESLKDNADFKYLLENLQMCKQKETTPFNQRKERERLEPNSRIPNEIIFNAYCDDEKFFHFIRDFADLANINDLPKRLMEIKSNLGYIG